MAIVNRSKRQLKFSEPQPSSLGPGSYDANYSLVAKTIQSPKILQPHQNKSKKLDNQTLNRPNPFQNKENMIIVNEDEELYVTQLKKKGIMERSKSKRHELTNERIVPGPGSYNIEGNILKSLPKYEGPKLQKSHILEEIFKYPYYQISTSIPDLGPEVALKDKTHKAAKHFSLIKQPGFTLSKDQRFRQNEPLTNQNPGPGAYELASANKIKRQPPRNYGDLDKHLSRLTQDTSHLSEDSDDSIQYVKEALPGPGSYDFGNQSGVQSSFNKSFKKFGSTAQRFKEQKVYWKGIPYDEFVRPTKRGNKKGIAFGRSKSSMLLQRINKSNEPGPGYYNDTNTILHKVDEKYMKGYQGNFGNNAIRFKPFRPPYEGRTDFYISTNPHQQKEDEGLPGTWAFNSRTNQGESYYIRKDYTTENYYSQDFNTIKQKLEEQNIRQTEQVVLQPSFGSGVVRFNYKVKQFQEIDDEENGIMDIPFEKNEFDRGYTFSKSKQEAKMYANPGPGSYTSEDKWNTKSHNILFIT